MEEREFMYELCAEVLDVDKNIRFAGVIDDKGLLIAGKYRPDIEVPYIVASHLATNGKSRNSISKEAQDGEERVSRRVFIAIITPYLVIPCQQDCI